MTDHLAFEQLSDLADGAVSPSLESSMRAHLRVCEECASRLSGITALAASAGALPREIAPPDGLWADIRSEITSRETSRRGRRPLWRTPQFVAAAVVIAVASSALTALYTQVIGPRRQIVVPALEQPRFSVSLASTEQQYIRSAEALQALLNERRSQLAPSTVATVERSLRVADSAIAEARDALAHDQGNRALASLFASNYERKIDLLRRATQLAPHS